VLAGACRYRGNGRVLCVDPFDGSGEDYSKPFYDAILTRLAVTQQDRFLQNTRDAGVDRWIEARPGTARDVSRSWSTPIDMLFLDGDHSVAGMRLAYESFAPYLVDGGILAVHNSSDRVYEVGHEGARRLVLETVRMPEYSDIRLVGSTTLATRRSGGGAARPRP
jgi:hypothetical protein